MLFRRLMSLALSVVMVAGIDLECIQFNSAENATLNAVEAAVTSAAVDTEALVKFDLTHKPVAIGWSYFDTLDRMGAAQANAQLGKTLQDFGQVTIGFAKESANSLVQIVELAFWEDLAFCVLNGEINLALESGASAGDRKRDNRLSVTRAADVAKNCLSIKFKRIASPAVFNITTPDQKVGATISDVASLFIPVGPEGEVVEDAAAGAAKAVDLALPGAEDGIRAYKKTGTDGKIGDHFGSTDEAQYVKKKLQEPDWHKENCVACQYAGAAAAAAKRSGRPSRLNRRGNVFGICCPGLANPSQVLHDPDTPLDLGASSDEEELAPNELEDPFVPVYNPMYYGTIDESMMTAPPAFTVLDASTSIPALQKDIATLSTGVIKWSVPLASLMSSDELFSQLRQVLTGPADSDLADALAIRPNGNGRMTSASFQWEDEDIVGPFRAVHDAASKDIIEVARNLKGLTSEQTANWHTTSVFHYTPPGEQGIKGFDVRGLHVDNDILILGTADTPGMIIKNDQTKTVSRVPIGKNQWQVMKGTQWNPDVPWTGSADSPTWHSVFAKDMADNGRVSFLVAVHQ